MRYLFIFINIFILFGCFQKNEKNNYTKQNSKTLEINTSTIITDNNFNCGDARTRIEADCGLDYICNSKNKIEIRLILNLGLSGISNIFILTNNNSIETAIIYENSDTLLAEGKIKHFKRRFLKSIKEIQKLFYSLKQNYVFSLPNQNEIDVGNFSVDDGAWYTLTFKVDNKFRTYNFNNPNAYKDHFPKINEFKNYSNIVDAFYTAFK